MPWQPVSTVSDLDVVAVPLTCSDGPCQRETDRVLMGPGNVKFSGELAPGSMGTVLSSRLPSLSEDSQ